VWGASAVQGFHVVWGSNVIWGASNTDASEASTVLTNGDPI